MNSYHVFLYKHVKTCEPLMKCNILEARGSYKNARKKEASFPQRQNWDLLILRLVSCVLHHHRAKWVLKSLI